MDLKEKLSNIQIELKVEKGSYNNFGKYNFRSSEDINEALKPYCKKYKVFFTVNEEVIAFEPMPIIKSTATIHDCKSDLTVKSTSIVGVDLNQKGMQTAQQFGSSSSYGKKYALGNLLLLDDTKDADIPKPITKDSFEKAKAYVSGGGLVSAISQKYSLTEEQEQELIKLSSKSKNK